MGLDSYLGRLITNAEGHKEMSTDGLKFPEGLELCGGMMSGNGCDGSFRGKVYAPFILDVTGEDLYEDEINLGAIATALEDYIGQHKRKANKSVIVTDGWDVTFKEVKDLAKLFRYAADNQLDYHAWY